MLTAAALASAVAGTAAAQPRRVVNGVVVDGGSQPLAGVTIQLAGGRAITSDDSGRFRLEIPHQDRVSFDLRRVGLLPSRFGLSSGGDTSVTVVMIVTAQPLEKMDVTAKENDQRLDITGFNQRIRERENGTNSGYFIKAEEIERRNPARLSQMFQELPGIAVCKYRGPQPCEMVGTHLIPDPNNGVGQRRMIPCPITFYLDGQRLNSLKSSNASVDIDALVIPTSVAGVEYYPSGNRIPEKYSLLNGSCGLVLIWTRRGG